MSFYADLHIHSKYSRATSRHCDLEHLFLWARKKGISVAATGDLTHPGWAAEIQEKLTPAEAGLFRLHSDIERAVARQVPQSCQGETRFVLSVEIATIYKKGPKTRKVHHVIYVPDFAHAGRLSAALSRIGNLSADGRPILGLDSRDLLEIVLDSGDGAYLVPAHIWTPWFSVLGSKSGFDAIEDCYGDLTPHVFAIETGLSSDPSMNWRLSALDRFALVSNSDAHSPPKMGRNACVFDCPLDYFAVRRALETHHGFDGTVEFYPEEGKYHMDGHRKCAVCLTPAETKAHRGICPACGKPVTVGVLHRVEELADRPEGGRRPNPAPFRSLIPLAEVLAEVEQVGAGSKRVQGQYEELLQRLGPELAILEHLPITAIETQTSGLLAEAIRRMRAGQVIRKPGYDGEFGVIRLFTPEELAAQDRNGLLFSFESTPAAASPPPPVVASAVAEPRPAPYGAAESAGPAEAATCPDAGLLSGLDPAQRVAAEHLEGPLLIVAGPGTGKTRTITHRIAHLLHQGVRPEACLAITFTRRAAAEMRERLDRLVCDRAARIPVHTFHGLGLELLREQASRLGLPGDVAVAGDPERQSLLAAVLGSSPRKAAQTLERIAAYKRSNNASEADGALTSIIDRYEAALRDRHWVDFEDLLAAPARLLEEDPGLRAAYRARFCWLSVDEYQDIDALQYRLLRGLAPPSGNVCAIGDPDQAIYSFRGADVTFFHRFLEDYPGAQVVRLKRSYRSTRTILDASAQMLTGTDPGRQPLEALIDSPIRIALHRAASERAEAEFVVQRIEELLGGHNLFSLDSGRSDGRGEVCLGFSDFAVLYRTDAQAGALCEALARSGIPYQKRSHRRLLDEPMARLLAETLRTAGGHGSVGEQLKRAAEFLQCHQGTAPQALGPAWEFSRSPESEETEAEALSRQLDAAVTLLEPLAIQSADDVTQFLDRLALGAEVDLWDPRAERVSLLTLHAAKGLEFDVVFIVGCEDGLLPLRWGGGAGADIAEERRLLYVGMTRARQRLLLSYARKRRWRGKVREMEASPFLHEIEEQLLERRKSTETKRVRRASGRQLELF